MRVLKKQLKEEKEIAQARVQVRKDEQRAFRERRAVAFKRNINRYGLKMAKLIALEFKERELMEARFNLTNKPQA